MCVNYPYIAWVTDLLSSLMVIQIMLIQYKYYIWGKSLELPIKDAHQWSKQTYTGNSFRISFKPRPSCLVSLVHRWNAWSTALFSTCLVCLFHSMNSRWTALFSNFHKVHNYWCELYATPKNKEIHNTILLWISSFLFFLCGSHNNNRYSLFFCWICLNLLHRWSMKLKNSEFLVASVFYWLVWVFHKFVT